MAEGNFNWQDAVNEAVQTGAVADMTAENSGGGEYTPPREGFVGLRLVEYIELGKHESEYKGEKKVKDLVHVAFEISGKGIEKTDDGKNPRITIPAMAVSNHEKSSLRKLFNRMNYDGTAVAMPQLLDKALRGKITHNTVGEGDTKKVYANLWDKDGVWTITGPFSIREDDDTGQEVRVPVEIEARTLPVRIFLWGTANMGMWQSIFIDGMTEEKKDDKGKVVREAKSKNYFQNLIKSAKNWQGSPMQQLLFAGGEEIDVGEPETVERKEEDVQASAEAKANRAVAKDPLEG